MMKDGHCNEEDYDRERPSRYDAGDIYEFREKMEKVHLPKTAFKEVHFCDDEYGQEGSDQYLKANYVDNQQGYHEKNFNNSNNSSWRNNNINSGTYQPPRSFNNQEQRPFYNTNQNYSQNRTYNNSGTYKKPKYRRSHNSNQSSYQGKAPYVGSSGINCLDPIDELRGMILDLGKKFEDLSGKFDGLSAHIKVFDNQVVAIASASKPNCKGTLSGNPEENHKDFYQHLGSNGDSDGNTEEVITRDVEPEPRVYTSIIPFPRAIRAGQQKKTAYEKVIAAIRTIEE